MNENLLNEAQKTALPDIRKRAARANLIIEIKLYFLLALSTFIIIALNEAYIENLWFVGIMAFVNAQMAFMWANDCKKLYKKSEHNKKQANPSN